MFHHSDLIEFQNLEYSDVDRFLKHFAPIRRYKLSLEDMLSSC